MGFFSWFKEWATRSNRRTVAPRNPDLHPIDVKKLAVDLQLRDEAKRLGEGGIPAADAVALTAPEAAAIQKVETYRQGYLDWAVDRFALLTEDLGKLNVTPAVNHALNAHSEFERKAAGLLSEKNQDLLALSSSAHAAKSELEAFRAKHKLDRGAHWPKGSAKAFACAVVFFLIAFEGMANASFFAQGLNSGLIGGLQLALIAAAVNVVLAFLLGRWVRYLNHRQLFFKALGLGALAAAIVGIVTVGLGIGHIRDAMTAEAEEPARAAYQALLNSPFGLRDLMSWLLLLVSLVFGFIAMFDGYKMDDPYPGYGKVTRRTSEVIDDYEHELEFMRQQLQDLKDEELGDLDMAIQDAQAKLAVFRSRIDEKEAAAIRLETALQNADNSMLALLTLFRNENELYRGGAPRPKYFDVKPTLKDLPFPDFSTVADLHKLEEQMSLTDRLISDAEAIRASIQAAFNHQYDRLKPLEIQYVGDGEA